MPLSISNDIPTVHEYVLKIMGKTAQAQMKTFAMLESCYSKWMWEPLESLTNCGMCTAFLKMRNRYPKELWLIDKCAKCIFVINRFSMGAVENADGVLIAWHFMRNQMCTMVEHMERETRRKLNRTEYDEWEKTIDNKLRNTEDFVTSIALGVNCISLLIHVFMGRCQSEDGAFESTHGLDSAYA
jgi:hypothetical protein